MLCILSVTVVVVVEDYQHSETSNKWPVSKRAEGVDISPVNPLWWWSRWTVVYTFSVPEVKLVGFVGARDHFHFLFFCRSPIRF